MNHLDQELLQAIKSVDYDKVKSIVESGVDLNAPSPGGTYLDWAWGGYREWDFEIVKLLIAYGADLNDKAYPSITSAARKGRIHEVQYLLDRGAQINAVSHVGTTALWHAAYNGDVKLAAFLIQNGMDLPSHGGRALGLAAFNGHLAFVKLLVEEGVDIDYQSFARHPDDSNTPLHSAACAGHVEVVRYLLERGADVRLKNHYGDRPYHVARFNKRHEIMELITGYEPKELHDLDKRIAELKKAKLPTAIIKDLAETRIRIELPDSKYFSYVEFCSLVEITEFQADDIKLISLLADADAYGATGMLVWIPCQKSLGSYDIEHQSLTIFRGVSWKKFFKSPGVFLDRLLDGEYEAESAV
ncbi:ankyrin repeat domain-containing protein [Cohnella hashimotonis]|uniref:Ankyrin repeat domain-containing protein n=1 Tax=Cohnella hashimotonis TaxID=2826895 RepID=A0ABT6TR93_9BACL|nr:ankyrin repeat domain-containing protein [Cohnella hashimotonis]